MQKTWVAFLISGLFVVCSTIMLPATAKAAEESISGQAYLAIQAAMNEFKGRGLDISRYRIIFSEAETYRFVAFIDADVTEEQRIHVRGSPGKIPGFEVEFEPGSLRIVRSSFIR
jgi:hypothetical protein